MAEGCVSPVSTLLSYQSHTDKAWALVEDDRVEFNQSAWAFEPTTDDTVED